MASGRNVAARIASSRHVKNKTMIETAKVVAAIAINIQGAFDHLSWLHIKHQLAVHKFPLHCRKIIKSYLSERTIQYEGAICPVKRGCPQGGVLSGPLSDIGYNYILQWLEKQWVAHLCYADGTLLLVSGESVQEVQRKSTQIIRGLKDQMEKSTLNLNTCLLYTSPSPRDRTRSRMPSSA